MRVGVPKETKPLEGRVALVPAAAGDLVRRGHEVWIERGAGLRSGFADADYERLGARIAPDAAALYERGELIVKVKEPIEGDLSLLRGHHLLFCYLHLAPEPALARRLVDIGLSAIAFETVELDSGELPLLAPMSVIAGRIAVQVGTTCLHQPNGGKGTLLGGLPSTPRGKVVVFGAGQAGGAAVAGPAPGAGPFSDTRVYFANVTIESGDLRGLRPGLSAEVSFKVGERDEVTRIPQAAIRWQSGQSFAAVATQPERTKWEWRPIELGMMNETFAEVLSGLDVGDQVVANPNALTSTPPIVQETTLQASGESAKKPNG